MSEQSATPVPLQPPASSEVLSLTPPGVPERVQTNHASEMAPPVTAEQRPVLDAKVDQFMSVIMDGQAGSPEFSAHTEAVRSMGDVDIRKAAEMSNRLLDTPLREMKSGGLSDVSKVSATLLELRRIVEHLDPNQPQQRKFLGLIPYGDKVRDYFRKYQSSQQHLNAILHALRSGQDELIKDNIALNSEKQQLWETMNRLNQYIYLSEQLDERLTISIAELQASDPLKAETLSKDVLFYVRQKHQDLLTQLAVSIQGYLALDVVIKNNSELVKGVDRASTTTVSALRTAVIAAEALANQKLVLDQISALNSTTSSLIERTSEMMRSNSLSIQQQASSSTVDLESLKKAFANIYATMDSIDRFKVEALNAMSQTINTLEGEVMKSRAYLERVHAADMKGDITASLTDPNHELEI